MPVFGGSGVVTEEEWRGRVDRTLDDIMVRLTRVETKNQVDEVHRQNVEKRRTSIEGTLQKLFWIVIVGIGGGIMNFVMSGGFNVSP